ncbi:bifunctional DNA-formamidopyrimidine glycosylase/DNA-(apurinic or apyrimidinic site) lyase [Erysipelothrix enhydrae]|uniref:bifunctional DNA-formamidopyrimidine glycosylase/DNA-(apurinic or apyrimidinic site) lyase n=1 Tax=Erysipelothrix enhydrae TaxID=2890314 RepID=UPI002B24CBD6|nr:bifunctional DNA-formamidopyrimidine glycosylase/DNA-(apurinic or apyrimidinic site) lyase [Erysipelothrix sp. 4322-04]WRB86975.1 bifunctional DNA-formamidopyrimidine glycosylase/DNA-(apurinic or apyrimidinic site) lyase [Erysipelothrix sp. 4322-04]
MPELPEVETIIRTLEKSLKGKQIDSVNFIYPKLLEDQSDYPLESLVGSNFKAFHRRGKYLWFEMSNDLHWILHLRMEGKFHLYDYDKAPSKHTHCVINYDGGTIHYLDTRKFSRMAVVKDPLKYLETKNLGYEPFDSNLNGEYVYQKIHHSKRVMKSILLDQSIIAGIGNIYADEILFETQIHPLTTGSKITMKQCDLLVETTKIILRNAIKAGGTTVRSYTSSLNVSGRFQINLNAYGRAGDPCSRCGSIMKRIVVSGRSTVFCEKCQKVQV